MHAGKDSGLYGGEASRPAQKLSEGRLCSPRLQLQSIQYALLVCVYVSWFPRQWVSILVSMATVILYVLTVQVWFTLCFSNVCPFLSL